MGWAEAMQTVKRSIRGGWFVAFAFEDRDRDRDTDDKEDDEDD